MCRKNHIRRGRASDKSMLCLRFVNYRMRAKRRFKIMSGTVEAMIPSHLDEFMFRDWMDLATDRTRCFPTIIPVIGQWFPSP